MLAWISSGAIFSALICSIRLLATNQVQGMDLIPDQLHSLSEVLYNNMADSFDWYIVDEYVDIPNRRSSARFYNLTDATTKIIYNEVNEPERVSRRKFITYYPENDTCMFDQFKKRPLSRLRGAIVIMLPIEQISKDILDVVIGPSSLLMAIEKRLADFRFVRRIFHEQQLIKVDQYEAIYDQDAELLVKDEKLIVTVQIPAAGDERLMTNTSLIDLPEGRRFTFTGVKICQVDSDSIHSRDPSTEYECSLQEAIIIANYYIVTNLTSGSLVGRELEETQDFNFERDPFFQSVGIGCWKDEGLMAQRRFTPPLNQFSAEYESMNGDAAVTYIAYDGIRNIFRLDREGRKSVYDLDEKKSYHVDGFLSLKQALQSDSGSCAILNTDTDTRVNSQYFGMEHLLGLGPSPAGSAIYLGSKTVDHVNYEVYETEYIISRFNGNLPIMFEARDFSPMPDRTRYFLTYYMDRYNLNLRVKMDLNDVSTDGDSVLVPRYVELWAIGANGTRILVNLLTFNAFSWALDVRPTTDSDSDLNRLFYIDTCAQERAEQMELRLKMSQLEDSKVPKKMWQTFKSQESLVQRIIQQQLASFLLISPLNIAQMSTKFLTNTLDLMVNLRLAELKHGRMSINHIGFVDYHDFVELNQPEILGEYINRHSLSDCKLDSLKFNGRRNALFCKRLARCLVVHGRAFDKTDTTSMIKTIEPDGEASCQVFKFDYTPLSATKRLAIMYDRVNSNLFELRNQTVQIDFRYLEADEEIEVAQYKGELKVMGKVKTLDLLGLSTGQAMLAGWRFDVVKGDDDSGRAWAVEMDPDEKNPFKYCQLVCNLDEYCQSFSLCTRTRDLLKTGDCLLSSLWLSAKHVEEVGDLIRANEIAGVNEEKSAIRFIVHDKEYRFARDAECTLHTRDFLSTYSPTASPFLINKNTTGTPAGDRSALNHSIQSLEDCAAMSHDLTLWTPFLGPRANFTFCPLSSYCFYDGSASQNPTYFYSADFPAKSEYCQLYQKSHDQLYDVRVAEHLVLTIRNLNTKVFEVKDMADTEYSQVHLGLHKEQCAQRCNLRSSDCFAFDVCYKNMGPTCITFSIRSPLSEINKRKGLLEKESLFYGDVRSSAASLARSHSCSHFFLKKPYAEVRVRQLLARSTGVSDEIDEIEEQVKVEDELIGDEAARQLSEERRAKLSKFKEHTDGMMRNLFLLLVGATIGCLGILYGRILASAAADSLESIRAKSSARQRGPRISQLDLTNNIQLPSQ